DDVEAPSPQPFAGAPGLPRLTMQLAKVRGVDEQYERQRARLLAAIARHEQGELDHAGLRAAIEELRAAGDPPVQVEQVLFEADVTLEHALDGQSGDGSDLSAALRRMRRNLREALQ